MPKPAHIVLLTTGQPSTNPRLVKEADALTEAGYRVTVVYCFWAQWGQQYDQELLQKAHWNSQQVGGDPDEKQFRWSYTRLRRKIFSVFPNAQFAIKRILCRAYDELLEAAQNISGDLYVAHSVGALPVAAIAARKRNVAYAFDAEDFYRGEMEVGSLASKQAIILEEEYISGAAYRSAASPLIGEAYQKLFPDCSFIIINNVFSLKHQPIYRPTAHAGPLSVFWFSQTTGRNRGIQDLIEAMNLLPALSLSLTLVGGCSSVTKDTFMQLKQNVQHQLNIILPVQEKKLFEMAALHDFGLASEIGQPLNRDLCLTNKLFTYLLAGNAILASGTQAQQRFIDTYPETGCIYPVGNPEKLAEHLAFYWNNRSALDHIRHHAWQLAHDQLNWEKEKQILLRLVESVLCAKS